MNGLKAKSIDESLNVYRRRSGSQGTKNGKKSRYKSKSTGFDKSNYACFILQETHYYKKDCLENMNKNDYVHITVASHEVDNEIVGELVVTNWEMEKSSIMETEFSYHMCHRQEYFDTFELKEGKVIQLNINKAHKINGIGTVWLTMFDNHEFLLHNMRHVPELKQNSLF